MRRLLTAAVIAALAVATDAGAAAPKPHIVDASGDAIALGSGYDVVTALFATEGTTARAGRRTIYTPTKLVVTVTYAADVATDDPATQVLTFDVPGCGTVYMQIYSGGTYGTATCLGDGVDLAFSVKRSGKTVTFSLPFKALPGKALKAGAKLTELRTYSAVADPVVGSESVEMAMTPVDDATTATPYAIR